MSREVEWSAWMKAALAGDGRAYGDLLAALTPLLREVARRGFARAGIGTIDIEDVVQESLLAIHLKRHTWRQDEPLLPWISAVARHKLTDALRRRGRQRAVALDDVAETLAAPAGAEPGHARDLDRLMGALNDQQRAVVRSMSLEERSARETATQLGMSEGAVRVALHRALKAMAAAYRKGVA